MSVGAGATAHVGGIAAYASNSEVTRSHYAGNLHSYQYNALLVIPIIETDVNLAGIVESTGDGVTVTDSYFKRSASVTTKGIDSVGSSASGASHGPESDEVYVDRFFWEGHDYDFAGGTVRSSNYSPAHINKWIMDYRLGIPVHGSSIKATFDFPGAGSVTIGTTALSPQQPQTTDDPWTFAVQGFLAADNKIAIKTDSASSGPGVADQNLGYAFRGWYRVPDITVNEVAEDPEYFKAKLQGATLVDTAAEHTLNNVNPEDIQFANNDLFIAHYQANVLFHDVKGGVVDKETGKTETAPNTEDDWYSYCDALPSVVPEAGLVSETATFIGWTTVPDETVNSDGGVTPGYEAITSTQLNDIKKQGAFYQAGDQVKQPMDLYPVYSDYISNVKVIFEGNEQDKVDDAAMRDGVGKVEIVSPGNGSYQIKMIGAEANGSLPDGYRFLGWYEKIDDQGNEIRVSTKETFDLNGVDLTQEHTYTARFEYRVDYWAKNVKNNPDSSDPIYESGALCESWWHRYNDNLHNVSAPVFLYTAFKHWSLVDYQNSEAFTGPIVGKTKVYSCYDATTTTWYVEMYTDFPDSANLRHDGLVGSTFKITASPNPGFSFIGYTFEYNLIGEGSGQEYGTDQVFNKGITVTGADYTYVARLAAKVSFYDKDSEDGSGPMAVVTRRYQEPVLLGESVSHTYKYVTKDKGDSGLSTTSQKAPDAPAYDGYCFLGWVDKSAIAAGEMTVGEWNYIFDVEGEKSCTSQASKAIPYLVSEDAVCTRPMELYPVYVKYDVTTTTNIVQAGVPSGAGINVPAAPVVGEGTVDGGLTLPYSTYTRNDPDKGSIAPSTANATKLVVAPDGSVTLNLTAENDATQVVSDQAALYRLTSWTIHKTENGVTTSETRPVTDIAALAYDIKPGPSYTFVANYEPMVVVYHLDLTATNVVVRNNGDRLGEGPDPTFSVADIDKAHSTDTDQRMHVFVGWTTADPGAEGYAIWDNATKLVSPATVVRSSMELWPVYRQVTVGVNSNIDKEIVGMGLNPADYRSLSRAGTIDTVSLIAEAKDVPGYDFVGWYTDYGESGPGTPMSTLKDYVLAGNKPFESTMYTAVYVKVYEVRYHDTSGKVIYTANVTENDKRTFVKASEVDPESGEAGATEQVPIDSEAYQNIAIALDGAADATSREVFSNWQWVKPGAVDGTASDKIVQWADFKDVPVKDQFAQDTTLKTMDLYPITWKISATDADGASITDQLTWAVDVLALETPAPSQTGGDAPDQTDPSAASSRVQTYPIQAYFGQGNYYDKKYLKVHVEKASYWTSDSGQVNDSGQKLSAEVSDSAALGKKIALYDDVVTGNIVRSYIGDQLELQDFQEVSADNALVCTVDGVEYRTGANPGDALFVFGEVQPLVVTKKTSSPHAAGEVFLFTVTSINEDGTKDTRTVSIQCSEKPENGYYVGSAQFQLKPGTYYVKENGSWAWRYDQTYAVNGMPVDFGGDGARVVVSRSQSGSSVVCENMQQSDSWLDGSARAINTFGTGAANNG